MKDASDRSRIVGIAVGCAALLGGMMAVMVGTTETATFHVAGNDPPTPGASALARSHRPLDRAPGERLQSPWREKRPRVTQVRWPPAIETQGTIGSDVNWFVTLTQTGKGSSMKYLASSFALVLLATPALAQSIGEKTGVNSVLGVAPTTADFVKEAAISDMFEIQSSQLAQERGNTSEKQFAATMIKDHQKTSEDIKAMISSGDLKADLPTALDSSHQSALDKLKSLKGSDFSSRYDSDQVSGHKDAVSLFERYAKGGENAKLKDWVDKTLPTLRHHLEMAQDLAAGKTVGSH
jgi:putative membrane protein